MVKQPYIFFLLALCACSCTSVKKSSDRYYYKNEKELFHIDQEYRELNGRKPFSLGFTDRTYQFVTLEIITDSLKYSYDFPVGDVRLNDTLQRYGMDVNKMIDLVNDMHAIRCRWVNTSDYYADEKKYSFTFISIKPIWINMPFTDKKYFLIIYFDRPQRFDRQGRLRTNKRFFRITDKVCYTFSEQFRN